MKIAVLVTCHNRKDVTIAGLSSLVEAFSAVPTIEPTFVVVDDGSLDGTGADVSMRFPYMHIIFGDGSLYWNGGMRRAFEVARTYGPFDAYLLFNDDVLVNTKAAEAFFEDYRLLNRNAPAILVAATVDDAGSISYSGMRRMSRWRPLAVTRVIPNGSQQRCDTFNGNFVLLPGPVFENIDGLDPRFIHAYGDVDLGYRAAAAGVPIWLAEVPIGQCNAAPLPQVPASRREIRLQRLRASWLKQDSLKQRIQFSVRHAPPAMWFVLILGASMKRIHLKLSERFL